MMKYCLKRTIQAQVKTSLTGGIKSRIVQSTSKNKAKLLNLRKTLLQPSKASISTF